MTRPNLVLTRTRLLLPLLLALSSLSLAEESPSPISLHGVVLDPGGKPLEGVRVELFPFESVVERLARSREGKPTPRLSQTISGTDGAFRLNVNQSGVYRIEFRMAGFNPLDCTPISLSSRRDLEPVQLQRAVVREIQIQGPNRRPKSGALVVGEPEEAGPSSPKGVCGPALLYGQTDNNGRVRFEAPEGVRLRLTAGAPGFQPEIRRNSLGATILLLKPGREQLVVVRDPAGLPAAEVTVTAEGSSFPIGLTDPQGRVTLSLPLRAQGSGLGFFGPNHLFARKAIRSYPEPVRVNLAPRTVIEGQVIDFVTRQPLAGALVLSEGPIPETGLTDDKGRFRISAVVEQAVQVSVELAGYRTESISLDHPALPGPVIALHPAAALAGRIRSADGQPAGGSRLLLRPFPAPDSSFARRSLGRKQEPKTLTSFSSPIGVFHFTGLAPAVPFLLEIQAPGSAPLTVKVPPLAPREVRAGLTLTLDPGRELIGRVTDPRGEPLAGVRVNYQVEEQDFAATVRNRLEEDMEIAVSAITDRDGRFRLAGLPAAELLLSARLSGFAQARAIRIDGREGTGPLDAGTIVLEPAVTLTGTVLDPSGLPIGGAEIQAAPPGEALIPLPTALGLPIVVSDADGRFTIPDLKKGARVDIVFRHRDFRQRLLGEVIVPQPQPLQIRLEPLASLTVQVIDPDRRGIGQARVTVRISETSACRLGFATSTFRAEFLSDDQGRVTTDTLPPGTAMLVAEAPGFQSSEPSRVSVGSGRTTEFTITLKPGSTVEGRILNAEGRPVVGAEVGSVRPESLDLPSLPSPVDFTDGAGHFRLEGLAPGKIGIAASHQGQARVVKDLDLNPGINQVDLELPKGLGISGRVVDENHSPVAGAEIICAPPGETIRSQASATSGIDGTFSISGLAPGNYLLQASAPGLAPLEPRPVLLSERPADDLELQLSQGAVLSGKIRGLDPDEMADLQVFVYRIPFIGQPLVAVPRQDGRFRLQNLGPGNYIVTGQRSGGRSAESQFSLQEDQREAAVELVFERGLVLDGTVFFGDEPLAGAMVFFAGGQPLETNDTATDFSGKFSLSGLTPGRYQLLVVQYESGMTYLTEYQITASRTIEIRIPRLSLRGTVVDGAERHPLAGVEVSAQMQAVPRMGPKPEGPTIVTDPSGAFEFDSLPPGLVHLAARKAGMTAAQASVQLVSGVDPQPVELVLDPGSGLELEVRWEKGGAPQHARVALLAATGRILSVGTYPLGENGRLTIPGVPKGEWLGLVSADGSAVAALGITVPGPRPTLGLLPSCRLEVEVAELVDTGKSGGLRVTSASGQPFLLPSADGQVRKNFNLANGRCAIDQLPPGAWLVETWSADGTIWSTTTEVRPDGPNRLILTEKDRE